MHLCPSVAVESPCFFVSQAHMRISNSVSVATLRWKAEGWVTALWKDFETFSSFTTNSTWAWQLCIQKFSLTGQIYKISLYSFRIENRIILVSDHLLMSRTNWHDSCNGRYIIGWSQAHCHQIACTLSSKVQLTALCSHLANMQAAPQNVGLCQGWLLYAIGALNDLETCKFWETFFYYIMNNLNYFWSHLQTSLQHNEYAKWTGP